MIPVSSVSTVPTSGHASEAEATKVLQALAQDSQSLRFKKLLIYSCTGTWESDTARLEAVQFSDLLHTLRSLAPTWQELQTCLTEAAHHLNRPAEYILVAHTLLGLLKPIYLDAALIPTVDPQIYEAIAQQLTIDPEPLRLKKLLILACTHQWESDRKTIEQTPLLPLIQTLHSLTPTRTVLCVLLENVVKTLSKSTQYRLLADRLIQAFQPLYLDSETVAAEPTVLEDTQAECFEEDATSSLNSRSAGTKFSTIAEATAALSALLHEQNKRSNGGSSAIAGKTLASSKGSDLQGSDLKPSNLRLSERFSLRQSVVQASNPLRTKILLFSLLHEPFQLQQHEGILKDYDLDDLLKMTMQTYRQAAYLHTALGQIVRQLPNPQAYQPSIDALLQAIQQSSSGSSALPANGDASGATQPEFSQLTSPLPHTAALTQTAPTPSPSPSVSPDGDRLR